MEIQWWFVFLLVAAVAATGIVVWRVTATANRGIDAVAGTATEITDALKPAAHAAGHTIQGVGNIVHGAGEIVHAIADALRDKQHERVQLAAENASLYAQIEQLKNRRVSATAVKRQLEVAFFSFQSKYTSFRDKETAAKGGGMLGMERPTSNRFLGVVEADFTAKVGVDLQKLGFAVKGASTVYVFGAHHVQPIGLSEIKLKTLFAERRQVLHETRARSGAVEIQDGGPELADDVLNHRDDVLAEIQNSSMASALAEVNERVALGFFQAMMGAGRYEFVATAEPIEQPLTFEQLCSAINAALASQIEELESKRYEAIERAKALDEEIVQLAVEGRRAQGVEVERPLSLAR